MIMKFSNLKKEMILNPNKVNLFQKFIENHKSDINSPKFSFKDLNLKIGKIVEVQKVQNSNKLYVLKVDVKDEIRQIVSGLQKIYSIDELNDRKVVTILNLKKAKLAGVESNGMILAIDNPKSSENCSLLTSNLEVGEYLKCEKEIANSTKEMKIDKFLKFNLYSKNKICYFNDKKIEEISDEKGFDGKIR